MKKLKTFFFSLRTDLEELLEDLLKTEAAYSRPGFIGRIPFLLLLRVGVFLGIWLRFRLHEAEHREWVLPLLIILNMAVVIAAAYVTFSVHRRSREIQYVFIIIDIVMISFFYWSTGLVQSDLFLFYYLPLLTAAQYLTAVGMVMVWGLIAAAFAGVLFLLLSGSDPSFLPAFLDVFLPRAIFFLGVIGFLSLRQLERRRKLSRREVAMQALLDFRSELAQTFNVNQILDLTIRKAVEVVGAYGGHTLLVDYETGQFEIRAFTPAGYFRESPGLALGDEISRQIVQQKQSRWLNDVPSHPVLGKLFNPNIRSMLCVPIVAHDTSLGMLAVARITFDRFDSTAQDFLQDLAGHVGSTIERVRLLKSLREISSATVSALELDMELDTLLQELTTKLGFEFATISLVDDYMRTVEMVLGKNVQPGWLGLAKYDLDRSTDIQADIVRTGKTEIIEGWDERFNRVIYERFGHENFVRIFAPLVYDDPVVGNIVVGTIEAGCQRERREAIITEETQQAVEQLGRKRGAVIAKARPYILLELIAEHAMKIIGADSASIHIFSELNQPLLMAGAGKADKEFMLEFPPHKKGIGWLAMQTGTYQVTNDPRELAARNKALYDRGVRTIAAFPLSLRADVHGVLYVHFWREHQFSQAEVELEQVFARQIEVAIQNNLLLKGIAEAAERAWSLSGLQNVIQSLSSGHNLTRVLEDVAQNVLLILDADNVTLYQYFQETDRFELPPVMKGTFKDKDSMDARIDPDSVAWRIVRDGQSHFIRSVSDEPTVSGDRVDNVDRPRFVAREGIKSTAVLVLRAGETREIVGLMFVNYRAEHNFGIEERKIIYSLASSAAIAIKTARLYERVSIDLRRRQKELDALHVVDRAIVTGARELELEKVLELILEKGLEIIGAPVGYVVWFNPWDNILQLIVQRGVANDQLPIQWRLGEGIVGQTAQDKRSILVPDVWAEEWAGVYKKVVENTRSELAVPLVDQNGLLGVLNVEHPEAGAFSEDDRALLETLAVQAIIAVHSLDLYKMLERQIKPLRALSLIATLIQDAQYDLDTVLRLLLTGVTAESGLGFSRALLFLTDDEGKQLQGKMAIGAQTRQEAEIIWREYEEKVGKLRETGEDILSLLLDQAEEFSVAVREKKADEWPMSAMVRSISVPVEIHSGALAVCILERKSLIIADAQPDPFRKIIEQISQVGDAGRAFACVPLAGKGKTIGVLVVDNRFLINEREIDEEDVRSLEAFAGVAAISIENFRLQTRLTEEHRLANWKDFAAKTAHIIGTRVAVTAGEVSRLNQTLLTTNELKDTHVDEARIYLGRLRESIQKAERTLLDFRKFAAPLELQLERIDLILVLKAVVHEIANSISCSIDIRLADDPLIVDGDPNKLSDAFIELIRNACEAMLSSATRNDRVSRITISAGRELLEASEVAARIEFADTGPGVPESHKKRVFEPFFSKKGTGSGLGLAIIKNIIDEHQGTIEEVGIPGLGAQFVILLPMHRKTLSKQGERNG